MFSLLLSVVLSGTMSLAHTERNPVVEAKIRLTGQTQEIPPTTIFTPKSTGMFRLSFSWAETKGLSNGAWSTTVRFTNVTPATLGWSMLTSGIYGYSDYSVGFLAIAGKPVTFEVHPSGDISGSSYDLFIVIERLTKIPSF